jgi:hypothetical protein
VEDTKIATLDTRQIRAAMVSASDDETRPLLGCVAVWVAADGEHKVTAATNQYSLCVTYSGTGLDEAGAVALVRETPTALFTPADLPLLGKEPYVQLWSETWRTAETTWNRHGTAAAALDAAGYPRLGSLFPALPEVPTVEPFTFGVSILALLAKVGTELDRGIKPTKREKDAYRPLVMTVRHAPQPRKPFVLTGRHVPAVTERCEIGVYWVQMPVRL